MAFDPSTLSYNEGRAGARRWRRRPTTGEVLMLAWMNAEAVARTLETGRVTYWSRSRQAFWVKGETSGHVQKLVEMRVDCDRDALLVLVDQVGPACHTNRPVVFLHRGAGRRRSGAVGTDGLRCGPRGQPLTRPGVLRPKKGATIASTNRTVHVDAQSSCSCTTLCIARRIVRDRSEPDHRADVGGCGRLAVGRIARASSRLARRLPASSRISRWWW